MDLIGDDQHLVAAADIRHSAQFFMIKDSAGRIVRMAHDQHRVLLILTGLLQSIVIDREILVSVIDQLELAVDGNTVDEQDLRLCLNGKEFAPWELKEAYQEFWGIKTPATLKVRMPGGLTAGDPGRPLYSRLRQVPADR